MLKTLVPAACLVLSLAACAPAPTRPSTQTMASSPPGCVNTASRIDNKNDDCAGFGQSYTQQDIQRTGGADTGQALRLLDPTLTVHGH
jgi:hypothetical protein